MNTPTPHFYFYREIPKRQTIISILLKLFPKQPIEILNIITNYLVFTDVIFIKEENITDLSEVCDNINLQNINRLYLSCVPNFDLPTNLVSLSIDFFSNISDFSFLSSLINLRYLNLFSTNIIDLQPLSSLIQLEHLNLGNTAITTISPLSSLVQLKYLSLTSCDNLTDISPLSHLINLQTLAIHHLVLHDLSPLFGLHKLRNIITGWSHADYSEIRRRFPNVHITCFRI